jgi:hypothetical protein
MTPWLHLDAESFSRDFGHAAFPLRHGLAGHPLTELPALAELADSLDPADVEHNLGQVPDIAPGGEVPKLDATPGEIVRGIEENGSWIVLPLHRAPAGSPHLDLLDELVGEMSAQLAPREGRVVHRHAVIFLAAPRSTTPAHIDLEQGLLLQIRGAKDVAIGEWPDPVLKQREVERMQSGGHRNVAAMPDNAPTFHLEPGDGMHVPAFVPHLVKNGETISVSLSAGVRTEATLRASSVHSCNARLRRLGLRPAPPGLHPRSDRVKASLVSSLKRGMPGA